MVGPNGWFFEKESLEDGWSKSCLFMPCLVMLLLSTMIYTGFQSSLITKKSVLKISMFMNGRNVLA